MGVAGQIVVAHAGVVAASFWNEMGEAL